MFSIKEKEPTYPNIVQSSNVTAFHTVLIIIIIIFILIYKWKGSE